MTGRPGLADGVAAALAGLVLAVAAAIWLWGGVAGALFGHGWPHLSAAGLVTVVTRDARVARNARALGYAVAPAS